MSLPILSEGKYIYIYIYILDPHEAPYGACKSYKAEFEEVQHSEGQISKTIEQSRRKERREKRRGKKEKRSEKLC